MRVPHLELASMIIFPKSRFVLLLLFLFISSSAVAQSLAQNSPQPKGKSGEGKRTTINFEDQLIEGEAQKPELFYLLQQKNNNFKRLIRLRENFLPEMRKTSEEIGRSGRGSGN